MENRDYNPFDEIRRNLRSKKEKEAEKRRVAKLKEEEKVLMDELRKVDKAWHEENDIKRPDYELVFAPELNLKRKEYDKNTDEELEKRAQDRYTDRYVSDRESIKDRYKDKYADTKRDISDIYNDEGDDLRMLSQKYAEKKKDAQRKSADNGISKSSISDLMELELIDEEKTLSNKVREDADTKAGRIEDRLKELNRERDRALMNLDIKRGQDISREISRLKDERKKNNDKVTEYNNAAKDKEHAYKMKRSDTIDAIRNRDAKNDRAERYFENKVGMRPHKDENYRERYDMASRLYNQMPRDEALKSIRDNRELRTLLGKKYYDMLIAYQNTRGPI